MKKRLLISSLVASFLIGCGGNSSSSSSGDSTESGTYEDAPVAGLTYETTSGITGLTDSNGTFKYKAGDKVTFKIGNVVLGSVEGKKLITPYDSGLDEAKKIVYVLQSLDTDGNATNDVIKLPDEKVLQDYLTANSIDEVNVTDIKNKLKSKLKVKFPDLNKSVAVENLNKYLSKKTDDPLIKDVLKKGLLGLQNKNIYYGHIDSFDFDTGTVSFGNDSNMTFEFKGDNTGDGDDTSDGESGTATINSWGQNQLKETINNNSYTWNLLKVDVANNIIYVSDGDGIYVLASSKDKLNGFKNKFTSSKVDAITLKNKYFYYIDSISNNIKAVKLTDNAVKYYNIDAFEDDSNASESDNKQNYSLDDSDSISYSNGNIVSNGQTNEVRKISLAGKVFDSHVVGLAFDNLSFTKLLNNLDLNNVKFTKGNVYCLSEDKCYLDKDAMNDLYSAIMSSGEKLSIKKGSPKTPTYTKLSDYIKDKDKSYYEESHAIGWIDYDKITIDGSKFKFEEIDSLSGDKNTYSAPVSEVDNVTKIIAEYDNGILVKFSTPNGISYTRFLFSNEDDVKKEYNYFLPFYQNK
jgi:hypothetical protein